MKPVTRLSACKVAACVTGAPETVRVKAVPISDSTVWLRLYWAEVNGSATGVVASVRVMALSLARLGSVLK